MRVELQPAYLLYAQKVSDSRLRVECLTQDHGLVGFIARAPSRKKSPLLPFQKALISWVGKSSLKTLTQFESVSVQPPLIGNNLYCGFYLNELSCRLLPKGEQVGALFSLYEALMNDWQMGALTLDALEPSLRAYELTLMQELGYAVDFEADCSGLPIESDSFYQLLPAEGFMPCESLAANSFCGSDIAAISRGQFGGEQRSVAKRITRILLAPHLGRKPLKSREFFIKPTS